MNISNQLVSFNLSKKLEKLGVDQSSYFGWYKADDEKELFVCSHDYFDDVMGSGVKELCAAFTVAELGNKLKDYVEMPHYDGKVDKDWYFWNDKRKKILLNVKTEANARAKMVIYLLENKLVKVENINAS